LILRAPAKLNLCLYLGRRRDDGLHELCSLFCRLALSDRITVTDAGHGAGDDVICPSVGDPNLVATALDALRARGWRRPPLRIEIEKRIPVAAGLGGGSADAAALLRLARDEVDRIDELAAGLGADVPAQLDPGFALVRGAGETLEPLPAPGGFALVLLPAEGGLSTADVYAEADRMGLGRAPAELTELAGRVREAAGGGASPLEYTELLVNDLEHAALSLRPEIAEALVALEQAGAARALLTGSGPTAFGLFPDLAAAESAADSLPPRFTEPIVTTPGTLGG
jgi:4-diphosphocytidyl-2-C-methyl-D-erythritol kinase